MRNTRPATFIPNEQPPKLIALKDVPKLKWLPRRRRGARLNVATVYRWKMTGGLRVVRVGGQTCTTESWLRDFFERDAAPESAHVVLSPRVRQQQIDAAEHELQGAGFEIGDDQEK